MKKTANYHKTLLFFAFHHNKARGGSVTFVDLLDL